MPTDVTMDKIVSLCRRRGFVFPVVGDLRRAGVVVRLRPLRRPAQGQRQGALARGDGARAGRHRRARLVDHPPPEGVGGVRPRRRLQRPARRLPHVQAALPRRSPRGPRPREVRCGKRAEQAPGETSDCDLTEPRQFNLMFRTRVGAVEETGVDVYLRPETAQGIFVNFKNVAQLARRKPPFGIAQVGKAFRNEITPGNFIFRTLEFEQMEMEFFVPPTEADEWYRYWVAERLAWHARYGIREENLRVRPARRRRALALLERHERHRVPVPDRLVGARGDREPRRLRPHAAHRGLGHEARVGRLGLGRAVRPARDRAGARRQPLDARVPRRRLRRGGRRRARAHGAAPPSAARARQGRGAAADRQGRGDGREGARALRGAALARERRVRRPGAIGRRYRRQDEIGTPWAFTIDEQTLEDGIDHAARPRLARPGAARDRGGPRAPARAGSLAPWSPARSRGANRPGARLVCDTHGDFAALHACAGLARRRSSPTTGSSHRRSSSRSRSRWPRGRISGSRSSASTPTAAGTSSSTRTSAWTPGCSPGCPARRRATTTTTSRASASCRRGSVREDLLVYGGEDVALRLRAGDSDRAGRLHPPRAPRGRSPGRDDPRLFATARLGRPVPARRRRRRATRGPPGAQRAHRAADRRGRAAPRARTLLASRRVPPCEKRVRRSSRELREPTPRASPGCAQAISRSP